MLVFGGVVCGIYMHYPLPFVFFVEVYCDIFWPVAMPVEEKVLH